MQWQCHGQDIAIAPVFPRVWIAQKLLNESLPDFTARVNIAKIWADWIWDLPENHFWKFNVRFNRKNFTTEPGSKFITKVIKSLLSVSVVSKVPTKLWGRGLQCQKLVIGQVHSCRLTACSPRFKDYFQNEIQQAMETADCKEKVVGHCWELEIPGTFVEIHL